MDVKACRALSYGLYIVTAQSGDRRNGQVANTLFQVTSSPLRIVASINKDNLTHELIAESGAFAVSVLDIDAPMTLIGTFGFKSGRDIDKFAGLSVKTGTTGCPIVLDHALSFLEAKVTDRVDMGTHTLFVAEVVGAEVLKKGEPMTYAYYHEVKGGKTPKNAATFLDEPKDSTGGGSPGKSGERYACTLCGYEYDPAKGDPEADIPAGTAFEDLPDDWVCPVCGAAKDQFDKV